ncbi:MAG: hypothetical protein JSV88_22395 [Candidatus Aminicenantes bacterium]|nr:MAG: hypothetical protein JSV88_22395 [Candidatus Aminicenantes bacterium]
MSKKETITYSVICPFGEGHKFPVVLEVDQKKKGEGGSFEAHCPFCDKYVRVNIEKELKPDKSVLRGLGFDNESTS